MKKIFVLTFGALMLTACATQTPEPEEKPSINIIDTQTQTRTETVTTVLEGETCGGPENLRCESPLFCYKEVEAREAFGRCINLSLIHI